MFFRTNKNKNKNKTKNEATSVESDGTDGQITVAELQSDLDHIKDLCVSFFVQGLAGSFHKLAKEGADDSNPVNLQDPQDISKFVQVLPSRKDNHYLVKLGFACASAEADLIEFVRKGLATVDGLSALAHDFQREKIAISVEYNIPIFKTKQSLIKNVKNIIAVSSGKGGVGKSATAVNLAMALRAQGARVGILDADIYGPSIPIMLNTVNASPQSSDNKHMIPVPAHGLVSNSIGYLVKNDHASIWRGPMASKALTQLANETNWPLLDYLIVDMPPGTGDIQLTMAQQLPLTAAVIVTTPQTIALSDAEKGIAMFNKLDVPVLGIIENMSYFECPQCHHQSHIFDKEGAQTLVNKYEVPLLAEVPLDPALREYSDNGRSIINEQADHVLTKIFMQGAQRLSLQMCHRLQISDLAKHSMASDAAQIDITQL
ncbi:iron-sulfur cluster carrier protein ApbC [Ningiella sp. W23]|uniref:iron-sulfur cluster carrier protein ApbC n=1 Tax=Ningiella sp. W23 TaxID=3023715 RepID=UPI003757C6F0